MPELGFVLKSLVIALVVMIGLQVKVGNTSLEQKAEHWVHTSSIGNYLQNVASGAVLAIRNAAGLTTNFVSETFSNEQQVTTQKAGRLNFEFKRSQKYQEEQASKGDE